MIKSLLRFLKKSWISKFGMKKSFHIEVMGIQMNVNYALHAAKADRDYGIILQLAANKKCILDIGANHGLISLLIARFNPFADIYAFEASEAAVNNINDNVAINKLSGRIRVVNALVADKSGYTLPFYWKDSSGGASLVKGRLGHHIEIEKSSLSIDDYVCSKNIKPDFVKIDVEGAESLVIKGMNQVLKVNRPLIIVELHAFGKLTLTENAAIILGVISAHDYHMIYLRTGEILTDVSVLNDRGRCHVLLLPAEMYTSDFVKSLDLRGL